MLFVCQQCGNEFGKWHGKCPMCGEWGSLVETILGPKASKGQSRTSKNVSKPIKLSSVKAKSLTRISTKIPELDRVLGGGIVPGQVILIAGEPGIGKSTILLQLADNMGNVLYATGEESTTQTKIRANRLGIDSKQISVMEETDIDLILQTIDTFKGDSLKGVVIDSIQTMSTSDLTGMAGSVGQVKECASRLVRLAKSKNVPIFVVGHVTKEGSVAGPKLLSHIVDTVLWFEGDNSHSFRLIRAVKNRFGPTDEVGVFSMQDKGLISVSNPEKIFLSQGLKKVSGNVATCSMKGTRPILTEIQSLVVPSKLAFPKRIAQGIDTRKLELLLAVLTRRCGLELYEYDCFVNVAGGMNVRSDPSSDLAVCLSVASAYLDKPVAKNTVAVGEVGLLGDIREVAMQDKRIKEAKRLGYNSIISSREVKYLQEAIKSYLK